MLRKGGQLLRSLAGNVLASLAVGPPEIYRAVLYPDIPLVHLSFTHCFSTSCKSESPAPRANIALSEIVMLPAIYPRILRKMCFLSDNGRRWRRTL